MSNQSFKVISVEGNIGVGKSTLLPKLAEELALQTGENWLYVEEEVDTNLEFQAHLKAFTDNPQANRVAFQNFMTDLRHNIGKNLTAGANYILERSLLSDLVFSMANIDCDSEDNSHITRIEEALNDYCKIDTVIHLQADPRVCYERMLGRGRTQEQGTPAEYIEHLENVHRDVLPKYATQYNAPLLNLEYTRFMPVQKIAQEVLANLDNSTYTQPIRQVA